MPRCSAVMLPQNEWPASRHVQAYMHARLPWSPHRKVIELRVAHRVQPFKVFHVKHGPFGQRGLVTLLAHEVLELRLDQSRNHLSLVPRGAVAAQTLGMHVERLIQNSCNIAIRNN
jgi:hypothetical protein